MNHSQTGAGQRLAGLCTALLAGALPLLAQENGPQLGVGDVAPALRGEDATGKPLSWERWKGRAVLLFFHAEDMAYSREGLEAVTAQLAQAADLRDHAALLIVSNGKRDLGVLQQQLDASKLQGAIAVDPERTAFREFHVVAFPSIYCLAPDHKIVRSNKGFGPLLAPRVLAGARLAAGLIDEKGYEEAVQRSDMPELGDEVLKVARSVRMAEQLRAAGMLDEARETLLKVLRPDSDKVDGVALLARVLLAQSRRDEARPWIERLAALAPQSTELRELRAESELLGGDAEAALHELEGVDDREGRVALLKGRAYERLQRYREAAEVYRRALERSMEQIR